VPADIGRLPAPCHISPQTRSKSSPLYPFFFLYMFLSFSSSFISSYYISSLYFSFLSVSSPIVNLSSDIFSEWLCCLCVRYDSDLLYSVSCYTNIQMYLAIQIHSLFRYSADIPPTVPSKQAFSLTVVPSAILELLEVELTFSIITTMFNVVTYNMHTMK
jgi:hypothetical protein